MNIDDIAKLNNKNLSPTCASCEFIEYPKTVYEIAPLKYPHEDTCVNCLFNTRTVTTNNYFAKQNSVG